MLPTDSVRGQDDWRVRKRPRPALVLTPLRAIASILNELGFVPLKGRQFTDRSVCRLLKNCEATKLLSPRSIIEAMLSRMKLEHSRFVNYDVHVLAKRASPAHVAS